jgi:Helix-turn-helix domain
MDRGGCQVKPDPPTPPPKKPPPPWIRLARDPVLTALPYLTGSTGQVLIVLAAHAGADGVCFPSQSRIQSMAGIKSRTTINKALGELERRGVLTIERAGGGRSESGAYRSNLYRLTVQQNERLNEANCSSIRTPTAQKTGQSRTARRTQPPTRLVTNPIHESNHEEKPLNRQDKSRRDGVSQHQRKVKGTMRHVKHADLKADNRLATLEQEAVSAGLIGDGERDRLRFWAAAQHALRAGVEPTALFAWIVYNGKWDVLTGADEKEAEPRIKAHYHGITQRPRFYDPHAID